MSLNLILNKLNFHVDKIDGNLLVYGGGIHQITAIVFNSIDELEKQIMDSKVCFAKNLVVKNGKYLLHGKMFRQRMNEEHPLYYKC